jgi:hypothetical protein
MAKEVDYHTSLIVKIHEKEISGKKAFVLEIEGVHHIPKEKQQTIDLINEANEGTIFANVGRKSEIKMICHVSGDDIIVDKVFDSNGKEIEISEIKSKIEGEWIKSISKVSTESMIPKVVSPESQTSGANDPKQKQSWWNRFTSWIAETRFGKWISS